MNANMIKNEINELSKRKKLIDRFLFPGYILWCFITAFSFKYVQILIIIISKMFNLDSFLISLLNELNNFVLSYSPLMLYIGSKIESKNLSKEIIKLNEEYQLELIKNRKVNDDSKDWVNDKNEVIKLYDIVERFDKLPRDKQMELLNYIKGDLTLKDKYTYLGIDKLSTKYKEQLLDECEDIIFPDYKEENNYTKKRKK